MTIEQLNVIEEIICKLKDLKICSNKLGTEHAEILFCHGDFLDLEEYPEIVKSIKSSVDDKIKAVENRLIDSLIETFTMDGILTDDRAKFIYKYAENILGVPIFTHEFPKYADKLKELSKTHFIEI